jgi:hypothetical protein
MPGRPSGADKQKERTRNQGSSGPGQGCNLDGPPFDRADIVPRGHLLKNPFVSAGSSRNIVNRALIRTECVVFYLKRARLRKMRNASALLSYLR